MLLAAGADKDVGDKVNWQLAVGAKAVGRSGGALCSPLIYDSWLHGSASLIVNHLYCALSPLPVMCQNGWSPLDVAKHLGKKEAVKVLRAAWAIKVRWAQGIEQVCHSTLINNIMRFCAVVATCLFMVCCLAPCSCAAQPA